MKARMSRVLRAAGIGVVRARRTRAGAWTFSAFQACAPLTGWSDAALERNPGRWRALFSEGGWARLLAGCACVDADAGNPPRSMLLVWTPRRGPRMRMRLRICPASRGGCEILITRAPPPVARAASTRDALTGIRGPAAWRARARRPARRPCAVLMADVDRFKRINDRCGHAAGDAVLREVAHTLRAALRRGDQVYRRGGDEFILCLADCAPTAAMGAAERLRQAIAAHRFTAAPAGRVRLSIGLACACAGERLEHIEAAADLALRRAKRAGRNCCKIRVRP
jgi:diguanylate cyclase (GGDEF)-like protein